MKLSEETKELLTVISLTLFTVLIIVGIYFGFVWMLGNVLLNALKIIFNRN